jgi:hypothetical protein
MDKPLANRTKQRREKNQIKIKDDFNTKEIVGNTKEIQRSIREYFENSYSINWKI